MLRSRPGWIVAYASLNRKPEDLMGSRDDQFWAEFLGVQPTDWSVAGISIRPHAGLSGYCGLWCFRRGDRTVVSAPVGWIATLASRIDVSIQDRLFDEAFLREMVDD